MQPRNKTINLTQREAEILVLIINGLSSVQMADYLNVGYNTIKTYRRRIRIKLNVNNAAGVVREAILHNLVKYD